MDFFRLVALSKDENGSNAHSALLSNCAFLMDHRRLQRKAQAHLKRSQYYEKCANTHRKTETNLFGDNEDKTDKFSKFSKFIRDTRENLDKMKEENKKFNDETNRLFEEALKVNTNLHPVLKPGSNSTFNRKFKGTDEFTSTFERKFDVTKTPEERPLRAIRAGQPGKQLQTAKRLDSAPPTQKRKNLPRAIRVGQPGRQPQTAKRSDSTYNKSFEETTSGGPFEPEKQPSQKALAGTAPIAVIQKKSKKSTTDPFTTTSEPSKPHKQPDPIAKTLPNLKS